jgi:hypothetical protein
LLSAKILFSSETGFAHCLGIFLMLTFGWPHYLIVGGGGPQKYKGKNVNHFSPTAVFFDDKDYWLIVQSDIGFFMALALVIYCGYTFGKKSSFSGSSYCF